VSTPPSPFVPTETPAIARANRLISLRTHPGFLDVIRISQEISEEATAVLVDYGGWDKDQIQVLKARAQAAKEHHALLLAKINDAIQGGIAEAKAQEAARAVPEKTPAEALETGDYVRQEVLRKFQDEDMRAAGSY
jgi:hypothetical protein